MDKTLKITNHFIHFSSNLKTVLIFKKTLHNLKMIDHLSIKNEMKLKVEEALQDYKKILLNLT